LSGDERQLAIDEVMKYNPHRSFPTIIIGDRIIIGFNEKAIREALEI
jgi:glutaredoxin